MPGRQSHGRSLMPGASGPKAGKKGNSTQSKSRSKSRSKALDAFAIAEEAVGPEKTKGLRTRDLEPSPEPQARNKRSRDDDDDEEEEDEDDEDEENDTRMKKRARRAAEDGEEFDDPDMEMEEDSEGNEWHVGVGGDDEDSEIDSDEAFGEEDEAEFEEFAFRGSKSKKSKKKRKQESEEEDLSEGDSDGEDLESLGSDAIDLATALDQFSETDEDEREGEGSSGSEGEDGDTESSNEGSDSEDDDDDDPAARDALKSLISGFAGDEDEDADAAKSTGQKAKIGLKDLGLFGVKDPHIKKSLKLMNKEEKATKPGASKKLDIPLAKRQQDKLLRHAAFEKTSETLERWTDTVKTNRRAEHLFFPLAQNAHDHGLDNGELLPLNPKAPGTELEQTIMAIMEESGMGPSSKKEQKPAEGEDGEPKLSKAERKELVNQRRRERDLASRELARAKRIKKIKSKAYRRVHRRERLGDEEATLAAMKEAGEIDSEEEKEAQDRRRAMERMGAKHKESRWAKMGAKAGRAVWDDDFKAGLTDMARRDEELRKRIEGRARGEESDDDDDDVSEASADSDTERRRLLRDLDRAAADDGKPQSALMQMKFMQRGEEALKKANDELVEQIRRDLASDEEEEDDDQEQPDVGRRQYGVNKSTDEATKKSGDSSRRVARAAARTADKNREDGFDTAPSKPVLANGLSEQQSASLGTAGAWSGAGQASRKGKKGIKNAPVEELDFSSAAILATTKSVSKPKKQQKNGDVVLADGASSDEEELHLPMAIRDTELIKRAFAGEDVVGEFQKEKREVAQEDDEKEVDNTLPGWGNWVGDGVSKKQRQKHAGIFITKVEGVKQKDRKDWKLERVIVNERRVRKNDKYLASQLPHQFESKLQYERSIRLPVGPEWVTKESFQDATKPRVILKPGVIAPMSKPMV
ncbi:Utp14 protein-domain-containing protein [Coniochaeta sp. 2T2.1]|nr:Utp14 protein-domain-containing protein [Coniochaeta sp. 2T2.1]